MRPGGCICIEHYTLGPLWKWNSINDAQSVKEAPYAYPQRLLRWHQELEASCRQVHDLHCECEETKQCRATGVAKLEELGYSRLLEQRDDLWSKNECQELDKY